MKYQELFSCVSSLALLLAAGCGSDAPVAPAQPTAGTAAVSGSVAGTGMLPSGVMTTAGMGAPMAGAPVAAPAGSGGSGTSGVAGASPAGAGGAAVAGSGMAMAGTGAGGMAAPSFVPGSPTFAAIYNEIIVGTGCNGGPTCHASLVGGQLKMSNKTEAFMALVGVKAAGVNLVMGTAPNCKDSNLTRVVAGDPEMSLLFQKISKPMPACGGPMPPSGALAADKVAQVKAWIMAGANDD